MSSQNKYLLFLETIESPDGKCQWVKGVKYKVSFEDDEVYQLGKQNDTVVGISKEYENKKYTVGIIQRENRS